MHYLSVKLPLNKRVLYLEKVFLQSEMRTHFFIQEDIQMQMWELSDKRPRTAFKKHLILFFLVHLTALKPSKTIKHPQIIHSLQPLFINTKLEQKRHFNIRENSQKRRTRKTRRMGYYLMFFFPLFPCFLEVSSLTLIATGVVI